MILTALAGVTKMTETCKSAVPNAIWEKKWWNTINIGDTLEVIRWLQKAEQTADICHNVDSLITVYVQFVIILLELKKVPTKMFV
jgi:hypothetical protein